MEWTHKNFLSQKEVLELWQETYAVRETLWFSVLLIFLSLLLEKFIIFFVILFFLWIEEKLLRDWQCHYTTIYFES